MTSRAIRSTSSSAGPRSAVRPAARLLAAVLSDQSRATGTQAAWQNVGTTFTFNANGELSPPITSLTLQNLTVNGDTLGNVQLQFGTNGLTQFAASKRHGQVNELQQNGFAAGSLQSVSVDSQNRMVGTFSNGQTIPLAQITLATFNGEDALQALNGGAYRGDGGFGAADLRGDRHHRRQFARSLERRHRHPVQPAHRRAAGLFGQCPRDVDRRPDDPEPAPGRPVSGMAVVCASAPAVRPT